MIEIKISARGGVHNPNLSQFLDSVENTFHDCRFHFNSPIPSADFWFVSEDIDENDHICRVPRSRVFFVSAETSLPSGYYSDSKSRAQFLQQFARVYTCHDVYLDSVESSLPFLPWMINANHGTSITAQHPRGIAFLRGLQELPKPKLLSVICSTQNLTAEHRMRLRFVEHLKAHYGDDLDWFGNGVRPIAEKWDGIAPYKYHLVLENRSDRNVITEKLYDSFLGLAFPLYWGAPNAQDYFDPRSFTTVDIRDLKGAIARIDETIGSDRYESSLPAIRHSRDRVLDEYNVFHRYAAIAHDDMQARGQLTSQDVQLTSVGGYESIPEQAVTLARNALSRFRRH